MKKKFLMLSAFFAVLAINLSVVNVLYAYGEATIDFMDQEGDNREEPIAIRIYQTNHKCSIHPNRDHATCTLKPKIEVCHFNRCGYLINV